MDVVYLYRTSYSEELKYSLRSLKNLPHDNVYIAGDKTEFNVKHIEVQQTRDIALNTFNQINEAVEDPEVSEDFILMHDDQFIMKPIKHLPVYHRGQLLEVLAAYKSRRRKNYYITRMHRTYNKLLQMGISKPLCYEMHIPFVINKQKWTAIAQLVKGSYNKLSMYGNINNIGGTKTIDVKVRRKEWVPQGKFASTDDATFGTNNIGKLIKNTFKEAGPHER